MTAITFDVARTLLAREWGPGDEVVVTRLDHDANIRPWVIAAERAGATVRWLGLRPRHRRARRRAPAAHRAHPAGRGHRCVQPASAPAPTSPRIARAAHEVGALVYVDAVHLAPHAPVDLGALGADLLACSPYKFFGPHLGVLAADPACSRRCGPTSCCPRATWCRSASSSARCPTSCWPASRAAVEFAEALGRWTPSRRTSGAAGPACSTARPHRAGDRARPPGAAYARPSCSPSTDWRRPR